MRTRIIATAVAVSLGSLCLLGAVLWQNPDETHPETGPLIASTPAPSTAVLQVEEQPPEEEPDASVVDSGTHPSGPFDPLGIGKCCSAIAQNMTNAPAEQLPTYQSALLTCNAIKSNAGAQTQLLRVRQLLGVAAPAACQ